MKLELGAGQRPTPGYFGNDINGFSNVDYVGPAWEINLDSDLLDEVLALAFMEHLTYNQVTLTMANVFRMLRPGGKFFFDAPNLPVWAAYLWKLSRGEIVPFTRKQIYETIYGWQRWPGDEHHSGWDFDFTRSVLNEAGFIDADVRDEGSLFIEHGLKRERFKHPANAHIYVIAKKPLP